MPWGGILSRAPTAMEVATGIHKSVWILHIWTYCMLPSCNFQGRMSFIFSPQWQTVYFGAPAQARAALHAEGLDYYFFSKEMRIEDEVVDAPLFSPNNISKYLAIRWTDGTNYLLTWPGPGTHPVDRELSFRLSRRSAEIEPIYRI